MPDAERQRLVAMALAGPPAGPEADRLRAIIASPPEDGTDDEPTDSQPDWRK
jgi:hypothetical protein